MQLGRLEEMDQSRINHTEKISKVQNVGEEHNVNPDEKYKNVQESQNKISQNEVILDNVKFGFNSKTKDFFVRVSKDGLEYQFPTEQIMRLKEHLHDELEEKIKNT
jgi:small-conductance mechanosensitive channel